LGLDKFKIHPSKESSFYEWVSYTPTSYISSIGRRKNIGSRRPSNISIELINEFEKTDGVKLVLKNI